jgi:hypothetical protein
LKPSQFNNTPVGVIAVERNEFELARVCNAFLAAAAAQLNR